VPRHMKRAMSQKSFLPQRMPGRIADDSTIAIALPGVAEGLREKRRAPSASGANARNSDASLRLPATAAASPIDAAPGRSSVARLLFAMAGFFRGRLRRRAERRKLRQTTEQLGRAPDTILEDLGFTRNEITYRVRFTRH
jgi:uncharacterized protein YjiS (DUF1127 family)